MPRRCSLLLLGLLLGSVSPAWSAEPAAPATGQLTRAPQLLTFIEAPFPAEEAGHTGTVVLSLTIDASGRVEEASVHQSASPAFDAAALTAARQFVFSPAEIDGAPARVRILYQYAFVERVAAPTTAIFSGTVRDRQTKAPLPGVTIRLGDGQTVQTDAAGAFRFATLPPGPLSVTLEGPRLTPVSAEETFVAGEQLQATYDVFLNEEGEDADDMEILVSAPTLRRQAVSTAVAADEARKVPGTQGDVLRVVENMPGVARASLGTGALVVWGASPGDTGVYVDGVPVPRLYHDGGLRSVMGSSFVESVELIPGGYGAGYGRALGGLVTVRTPSPKDERHARLSADLFDFSGSADGPIAGDVYGGIAMRQAWVGEALGAVSPDVEDTFPLPHYRDLQARVGLTRGPQERLELTVLSSRDQTSRTAPNPDPARTATSDSEQSFQRVSLQYQQSAGEGSSVQAVAFVGWDQSTETDTFGPVATALSQDATLGGLRVSLRQRLRRWLTAEVGLDSLLRQTEAQRQGSVALPAREGDGTIFGQPPPDQIAIDTFTVSTLNLGPYVEADLGLLDDALHLIPGLRVDPYVREVSRAYPTEGLSPSHGLLRQSLQTEPRLAVRWEATPAARLHAAWGRYGQQPDPVDLSAAFGNPDLPITTGEHLVLGGALSPAEALSLELTGFLTRTEGLATRNASEQPARAEALVATGSGRSHGVQGLLRLSEQDGVFGWVSYTLSWAERRASETEDWRPADHDQRHVLTALGGARLPAELDLGLRARLATGYPRTAVVGAVYDARRDLYQPVLGDPNGERLPAFFQADLRLARTFALGRSELEASFELQNLTNQQNVEEWIYNADYSERGAITGLPILPVLGLQWSL